MKKLFIKKETEILVDRTKPHLKRITPDIALNIFDIIRDEFYHEYMDLYNEKGKRVTNQWIGKAIPIVYNLWHKNEHMRVTEEGHLIKSYTVFYQ